MLARTIENSRLECPPERLKKVPTSSEVIVSAPQILAQSLASTMTSVTCGVPISSQDTKIHEVYAKVPVEPKAPGNFVNSVLK